MPHRAGVVEEVGLAGAGTGRGGARHGRRLVVAAADLDHVEAFGGQGGDHVARLVLAESTALKVRRVEFHAHCEARGYPSADAADDLEEEPHPSSWVAAPVVVAQIGQRRQELCDEVAVRTVHLDAVESGRLAHCGRRHESFDDVLDLGDVSSRGVGEPGRLIGTALGATGMWPTARGLDWRPG